MPKLDLGRMTVEERLELSGRIWDSLSGDDVALTCSQRDELELRLEDLERAPGGNLTWAAAKRQIQKSRR